MNKKSYINEITPYLIKWSILSFFVLIFIKEIIIENLLNINFEITNLQIFGFAFIFNWIILTILHFIGKQLEKNDEFVYQIRKTELENKHEIELLKKEIEKLKK
jgi:hypothetical protein